jgi:hypothetical protein
MRVRAGYDGQPLRCGELLFHLPLVAFGGRRQRIQLGLVGGEGGPELGLIHWHTVGVQLGAVNRDVLDPACPRSRQGEEPLRDAWGEQSAYDCCQDWR